MEMPNVLDWANAIIFQTEDITQSCRSEHFHNH